MGIFKRDYNYNPYFFNKIQPVGGIKFNPRSIVKGDGYEACLRIYDFPTSVNEFWLGKLIDIKDVTVTIDVETEDRSKALQSLNSAISENVDRANSLKNNIDIIEANNATSILMGLVNDITSRDEVIKLVTIRYYLSAKTEIELEEKIKQVLTKLEGLGYRGAVFLNEQEYEWKSLFLSAGEQKYLRNKRSGHPVPSISLGAGYLFHYVELNDPTGMFMGTSITGGNVIFDLFTKNEQRKSYNALAIGVMGSGKSTLLKKLSNNNAIVNNTLRILDITGEFKDLVNELEGKIVALDGSNGMINPLQIFATMINENTNEVQVEQSYMQHMSKVSMIYNFLSPEATQEEIREFERLLHDFYIIYGIEREKATSYKAEEYPTLSEFLNYIKGVFYEDEEKASIRKNLSDFRKKRLESIMLTIDNAIRNYGKLFDGHSSIEDLTKEQIVSFEIRTLTGVDKRIFNAQIFNVLSMLWNNALTQGLPEKKAFDEGKKTVEEAKKYLLLLDESHRIINSNNILAVDYLINFEREARKYFGGLIFATQSIRDVVPDVSNSEVFEKIRTLFELTQYKFIMQQDNNTKGVLSEIFSGQLTDTEINAIPNFSTGDCILVINGDKNIRFNIEISDREKYLFKGGA
ncbi:VirB4 family type IV secretion system protein [Clostridium perfringens]|uniref:VirB4 family type IV secretion system protein n=1 Tax=Clostridium perfringens TaxID=1502 RepID=UPI001094EADC|nr:ATP-binding protein [Clostridium perfringens]TGY43067.1 ATP-binding protein [Clostridium perfringens]